MVREPWVDLYSRLETLQNKGGQPFITLDTFMLHDKKCWDFTTLLQNCPKTQAFSPKIAIGGTRSQ